jgi:hypothetical protein
MPPDPPEDRQVLENERQVLAASTLVTHRRVKWTRECLPNKSSLKSFARGLGPDEPRIEALLLQGWRADLFIETSDSHIEPDVQRILRAASRGLSRPEASLIGSVEARLPSEGWVALGALTPHFREYGVSGDRDLMARCAGQFVFREYRGELFVARPLRPSHRTGDGHVTPSFEVLLGPDAHPEIGVIVGLFAELTRLDRVLTFKITEASVVNGLRAGRTVVEFLDALSAVGRHGVPENVSITVKDFASRASTIRPVWALEVPAAATDALMRELGAAAVASPRPGLVLASAQVSERDIAAAMLGAGLKPVSMLETPPAAEAVDERVTAAESPRREPDSALRDAVRREREGGFQGSYRAFETVSPRFHDLPERDAEEAGDAAPSGIRIHPGPAFATAVRALVEGEDVMTVATRSRSDGGAPLRTRTVAPSALIRRGNELVLLAEDVNTEANHAFPLSTIEWIEVQRPPAAALEQVAAERGISPLLKLFPSALGTERNDPCPCGSGKKYDRCHGVTN